MRSFQIKTTLTFYFLFIDEFVICLNCPGLIIDSNCGDIKTSEWNTKNMGLNLKEWIRSVKIVYSVNDPEKMNSSIRYNVMMAPDNTMLLHISILNCKTGQNIGAMWQIAGMKNELGTNGFNDGFFYVIPNKKGKKYLKQFVILKMKQFRYVLLFTNLQFATCIFRARCVVIS